MKKLLLTIDRISTFVGHFFAWLIVALTFMISWEVFSRYVFNNPHPWAFDVMIMMYGTLIMMAGAYTLSTSGHVRGDVLYGFFEPRTQAIFDLLLYVLFFIPGRLRPGLGRLQLRRGLLGDQRTLQRDGQRPAGLPVQDGDPLAGAVPAAPGSGRDDPLRDLHSRRRLAIARS